MTSNASASTAPAANNKPSRTANTPPNRLPAPTLFVGPPSRNASQLSISRTKTDDLKPNRPDPLTRQKSALSRPFNADSTGEDATIPPLKKASEERVEAKWKEMQSTLNEVELTAQSSTHVFGERHAAALDQLRLAQVELARAWGRGSESKATEAETAGTGPSVNRFKGAEDLALDRRHANGRKRADTVTSASTALSDESRTTEGANSPDGRSQLEDETAQDIKLASERRAANEAYFKKVDGGVKDVVSKLEVVAEAMRGVESESRSLWSSSDRSEASLEATPRRESKGKGNADG
ncbi:Hypothetical predicted protein [Lecanosticta acicola]|uniref:Uncharacterized protein n=1 Tax=Lecanosticta acicola TaxID=111012 RepID=A0AAI8Z3B1_9PEZI|nr:Hypothetical predicted protein [Lecanosticta acicola]